jgi:hypothetical protein
MKDAMPPEEVLQQSVINVTQKLKTTSTKAKDGELR